MSVNWKTGLILFKFDLGCELVCRRFERQSKSDLWTLYLRGDDTHPANGAGVCCHTFASSSEKRREHTSALRAERRSESESLERLDLVRRDPQVSGDRVERLLVNPMHFALFDAGDRFRRDVRLEVCAPEASLLAQSTDRRSE